MTRLSSKWNDWTPGAVVESRTGTKVRVVERNGEETPEGCFAGVNVVNGDISACWENAKFPAYLPIGDKGFRVSSAVYRMMARRAMPRAKAMEYLCQRAKMAEHEAKALVTLWMGSHPMRNHPERHI